MFKFVFYLLVLLILAVIGLLIGSANDTLVSFDYLIGKIEVSVGTVLAFGVIFGFILGLYASLILCIKLWLKQRGAKVALNKLQKSVDAQSKEQKSA